MVRQSIRERQRLMAEGNGLVVPLDFMLASHPKEGGRHWQGRAGIFVYELLTGRWPRGNHATSRLRELEPSLVQEDGLIGVPYDEAMVTEARADFMAQADPDADGPGVVVPVVGAPDVDVDGVTHLDRGVGVVGIVDADHGALRQRLGVIAVHPVDLHQVALGLKVGDGRVGPAGPRGRGAHEGRHHTGRRECGRGPPPQGSHGPHGSRVTASWQARRRGDDRTSAVHPPFGRRL